MFIITLLTIVKRWLQLVSIDGWMDKQNVMYKYNEILFSLKKEGNSHMFYNMDEPWWHYIDTKWDKPVTYVKYLR